MVYKDEIWKDIKGFEDYQVSNFGNVRSLKFGKVKERKPQKDGSGYLHVQLWKDGNVKEPKVHRLVANAFLENPLNLPCVNHKDECKVNNFVYVDEFGVVDEAKSNLEWCTHEYNNNYGTHNQRVAEKLSKPVRQYTKDFVFIKEWPSVMQVERELGYSNGNISSCCNGKLKTAYGYIWRYAE